METNVKLLAGRNQGFALGFSIAPKDEMISVDLGLWYWLFIWHKE